MLRDIRQLQQQLQQQEKRRTPQCRTISHFRCVIITMAMTSLVLLIRQRWHDGSNWFVVVVGVQERVIANNDNNSTTANLLLIMEDRLNNDNKETTSLSTNNVSLRLTKNIHDNPIPLQATPNTTKKNASVAVVEWNSNTTGITNINSSNQQQPSKHEDNFRAAIQHFDKMMATTNSSAPNNASLQFQQLGYLVHTPILVKARHVIHNKRSISMLNMTLRSGCGPLRRDWRDNPPISPMAQVLLNHQSNCSLPTITWHDADYDNGIGSHFYYWSLSLCAMHGNMACDYKPMIPIGFGWIRLLCDSQQAQRSPWLCYWPKSEYLCSRRHHEVNINASLKLTTAQIHCAHFRKRWFIKTFRDSALEFMFRSVSPLVIKEAHRQVGVLFGLSGITPPDLITVHLRWGDKGGEMKLLPVENYINAVTRLLYEELNRTDANSTANIYLATEDPVAVDAFLQAAPKTWKVFVDMSVQELSPFRPPHTLLNCASIMAKNTRGRGGLVNLGSILV